MGIGIDSPRKRLEFVFSETARYDNTYCWIFAFRDGQVTAVTEYADTELMRSVLGEPPQHAVAAQHRASVA